MHARVRFNAVVSFQFSRTGSESRTKNRVQGSSREQVNSKLQ